ncbi:hypothetical protein DUNSADRAFT_2425 [Dunaliella salina]|uniref:Encoded protein n=1 Tax=Dunaliella salina TaxID=3046 RepID=A0ABQ7GVM8_DUNSA|nr:hypothetical protein DUNSADRAFT_2425 [Dunaliella salina]|eukprot:KAF5838661.1 hypothetical protein DUNSADRAFT_2425 [Dunaliella salina]
MTQIANSPKILLCCFGRPKLGNGPVPPPMPAHSPDPAILCGLASTANPHLFASTSASSPEKQLGKCPALLLVLVGQHVCKIQHPQGGGLAALQKGIPMKQGTAAWREARAAVPFKASTIGQV